MDFLRIRKKAKEKSAAAEARDARSPPAPPEAPAAPEAAEVPGSTAGPAPAARSPAPRSSARKAAPRAPEKHASTEAAAAPAAASRAEPPAVPRAGEPPATEAEALEGALAARLQELPTVGEVRFTTWRPGSGTPPSTEPAPPPFTEALLASDFALVRPPGTSAREPFRPMAPSPSPAVPPPPRPVTPADPLDAFFYRADEDAPAVPGFEGGPEAKAASWGEVDVREEYITFLLGGEEYAVAIERVREVLRCPPLTEVPRAPAHVRGVVSVRGEVVAVVEPRRRLGLPEPSRPIEESRLLVVDVGDGPVGLLVDAVSNVVRLKPGSIEPCPAGVGGPNQEFLAGIGRERDRLFTVLDLGALLRRVPLAVRRRPEGSPRAG